MTTKKTAAMAARHPAKKPLTKTSLKKSVATEQSALKKPKHKKKVVRDSFTMPQDEFSKIAEIKAICLKAKMHVKKSEVLRAGLKLLTDLNVVQLKQVLGGLEKIKTGRPKKH